MQVLDDTNDALPPISQAVGSFMSRPTCDRGVGGRTLPQFDEELGTLRSTEKQLERVAPVGRKRRTFAPINILPPELLITVFTISIDYESDTARSNNETLMLVCRYWNDLVNNTPSLWTKIRKTAVISNARIIRALENSKDSSLEIEYRSGLGWILAEDETAFLGTVFPHAHRWRKASLWLRREGLERMTSLSTPLLETLSLSTYNNQPGPTEPLDIFGGRPPARLQELSLFRISVPWSPTTLCNLKVLNIAYIRHLCPSLDQLFSVLPASPRLESLSILNVIFSEDTCTLPPSPIHMPTLRKLSLQLISPKIITRLLAAVHAPKCKFGALRAVIQGDPFETLFISDISHFFDHMRSAADARSITCRNPQVAICWKGSWCINLDVDNIRVAKSVLNWLSVSSEHDVPAVPLHLTIHILGSPLVEDILAAMADTEDVDRVAFGESTPVAGVLKILTTGSLVEGGAREPFPGLKEMWIGELMKTGADWGNLLRMLRRRQRVMPLRKVVFGWVRYTDDKEEITKFRAIHWPSRLEEVRRLLGPEGELLWYRRPVTEDGVLGDQPAREDWKR